MKYQLPEREGELLPNLLGLKTVEEISLSEFEGFLKAEIMLTEQLTAHTKFDVKYLQNIHKVALGHLYSFAGKFRDVNLSKGGFAFPAAKFLPQTMQAFEADVLSRLPDHYASKDDLIKNIAIVHGELLFIHPFREGNGRTARILANLMTRKEKYGPLKFELIDASRFDFYVSAVQQAADKDYSRMAELIRSVFPN